MLRLYGYRKTKQKQQSHSLARLWPTSPGNWGIAFASPDFFCHRDLALFTAKGAAWLAVPLTPRCTFLTPHCSLSSLVLSLTGEPCLVELDLLSKYPLMAPSTWYSLSHHNRFKETAARVLVQADDTHHWNKSGTWYWLQPSFHI